MCLTSFADNVGVLDSSSISYVFFVLMSDFRTELIFLVSLFLVVIVSCRKDKARMMDVEYVSQPVLKILNGVIAYASHLITSFPESIIVYTV